MNMSDMIATRNKTALVGDRHVTMLEWQARKWLAHRVRLRRRATELEARSGIRLLYSSSGVNVSTLSEPLQAEVWRLLREDSHLSSCRRL
jgi:hypothetical protein